LEAAAWQAWGSIAGIYAMAGACNRGAVEYNFHPFVASKNEARDAYAEALGPRPRTNLVKHPLETAQGSKFFPFQVEMLPHVTMKSPLANDATPCAHTSCYHLFGLRGSIDECGSPLHPTDLCGTKTAIHPFLYLEASGAR